MTLMTARWPIPAGKCMPATHLHMNPTMSFQELTDPDWCSFHCLLQVHPSSSLPDFSCSGQWSISLNLQLPSSAVARADSSTPLLSVLSDAPGGWPSVSLRVSAAGSALAVQWGPTAAVREQPVSIRPNKDGWASVNVAVVRDGSRLGVWLDGSGSWLLQDVWCVPASSAVRYCTQPAADPPPDSTFRALRLGSADGPSSADIIVTSARVYNYALPRLSLAAESGCVEDGSCGRFLVSGWAPPAPSSIPAGSISGSSVEAVGSTAIPLRAPSHFLLVRVEGAAAGGEGLCEGPSACGGGGCCCRDAAKSASLSHARKPAIHLSGWPMPIHVLGAATLSVCCVRMMYCCRLVPGAPALHAAGAAGHRGMYAA